IRRVDERGRGGSPRDLDRLEREAHDRLRHEVGRIARPAPTALSWDDLILPTDLLDELKELAVYVRHRETVMNRYGMKRWGGTGLHILLSGEPGTGKSTAASILGRALDREVLQVNLDQVFSKYVGETEKQLVAVFELAERSRALLLLDEADALLAKRTEVSTSNDRYGNVSVNVVLQLMEQHSVVSVATTNREASIDDAGLRRFAFRFKFPRPDVAMRARLFQVMLPRHVDIDPEIDWEWLADKVEVTGGYIRNIMQRAGALAAAHGDVLSFETMVAAVNRELKQLGALPLRL
ncbi:MAG: ATP-binding protein, partial [Deltaproteobacteria bacterium]